MRSQSSHEQRPRADSVERKFQNHAPNIHSGFAPTNITFISIDEAQIDKSGSSYNREGKLCCQIELHELLWLVPDSFAGFKKKKQKYFKNILKLHQSKLEKPLFVISL